MANSPGFTLEPWKHDLDNDGNPIVGYNKLKHCVRLLFWSGQSFDEDGLQNEGKFKAADARFTSVKEIKVKDLTRWLKNTETFSGTTRTS